MLTTSMEQLESQHAIEGIEARLAGMQMAFLDDAPARSFFSSPSDAVPFLAGPFADHTVYSPPPSPTRMSSISRFQSPVFPGEPGTPSLMNGSLPSTVSSPSLAHTPMRYTTTRDPRPDTASRLGLGFSGLLLHDGSVFDGMGALPKRDESSELGFFMDEADDAGSWCDNEPLAYPEQEEDAWQKRISSHFDVGGLDVLRLQELGNSPSAYRSPQRKRQSVLPRTSTPILPPETLADDVFFSHVPMSSTPRLEGSRKGCPGGSHAVISSWRRNVQ